MRRVHAHSSGGSCHKCRDGASNDFPWIRRLDEFEPCVCHHKEHLPHREPFFPHWLGPSNDWLDITRTNHGKSPMGRNSPSGFGRRHITTMSRNDGLLRSTSQAASKFMISCVVSSESRANFRGCNWSQLKPVQHGKLRHAFRNCSTSIGGG